MSDLAERVADLPALDYEAPCSVGGCEDPAVFILGHRHLRAAPTCAVTPILYCVKHRDREWKIAEHHVGKGRVGWCSKCGVRGNGGVSELIVYERAL